MSTARSSFMVAWAGVSMPTSSSPGACRSFSSPPRLALLDSLRFRRDVCAARFGAGFYLVVSDVVAARAELAALGVDISEVFHRTPKELHAQRTEP